MPTDTYGIETDRHIEDAKASMQARMEEISRRVQETREKLDVKSKIAAQPLPAVGIAFAVGAALGLLGGGGRKSRSRRDSGIDKEDVQRGVGGMIGGAIVALVMRLAKDMVFRQLSEHAKEWLHQRQQGQGIGASSQSEQRTSSQPGMESFLQR